jgi:hypothetical protein
VLPMSAMAESSTIPSSSTGDPRGHVVRPAPSPQTLHVLAPVRSATVVVVVADHPRGGNDGD